MKKHVLILISSCAVSLSSFAQSTLTLQPDAAAGKDAELFSCVPCGYDNKNFGTKKDLNAIAWTNSGNLSKIRSLIQFNLSSIPVNATVTDARLSLYHNNTSSEGPHSGGNASYLQRVTAAWVESTVTWNNQPPTTSSGQVTLSSSVSSTQDYVDINVTALVQDMVSNPATNFGFMLRLQTETIYKKLILASSDHITPALRPKLVVTYITPLPVEFLFLEAENNPAGIQLKWATASETNNKGFELERTISPLVNFEKIAWIAGNGTTSSVYLYHFEDRNLISGMNYFYRLKQVDLDGNFSYSKIVSGMIPVSKHEITVMPNPFSESTSIIYTLSEDAHVRLEVYNQSGQKAATLVNKFQEAGNYPLQFTPRKSGYAPGIFEIIFLVNDQIYTKRIVEIK